MSFEYRARLFETHARNAAQGSRHACIIPRHQTNAQKQPLVGAVIGVVLVGLLVWLFTTESMSGSYLGYMAQQGVAETVAIQAATIFLALYGFLAFLYGPFLPLGYTAPNRMKNRLLEGWLVSCLLMIIIQFRQIAATSPLPHHVVESDSESSIWSDYKRRAIRLNPLQSTRRGTHFGDSAPLDGIARLQRGGEQLPDYHDLPSRPFLIAVFHDAILHGLFAEIRIRSGKTPTVPSCATGRFHPSLREARPYSALRCSTNPLHLPPTSRGSAPRRSRRPQEALRRAISRSARKACRRRSGTNRTAIRTPPHPDGSTRGRPLEKSISIVHLSGIRFGTSRSRRSSSAKALSANSAERSLRSHWAASQQAWGGPLPKLLEKPLELTPAAAVSNPFAADAHSLVHAACIAPPPQAFLKISVSARELLPP